MWETIMGAGGKEKFDYVRGGVCEGVGLLRDGVVEGRALSLHCRERWQRRQSAARSVGEWGRG